MKKYLLLIAFLSVSQFFYAAKTTNNESDSDVTSNVSQAFQVDFYAGANSQACKEYAIEGIWKKNLKNNWYFNTGLSLTLDDSPKYLKKGHQRDMFEIGVPLQIEYGKLNFYKSSFYGLFGFMPAFYTTLKAKNWNDIDYNRVNGYMKSGLILSPSLEIGGNIPLSSVLIRIGGFWNYKINCTPGRYNVYRHEAGLSFVGLKAGVIF
ncbi:MAG: hypothetical protein HDS71_06855 [Bacteroidales bacterium]|nr:hypothetical protein [Bacteroidales bacterium]MBD5223752.1 hypothetical protein [Bacteroidales bacterium]